MTRFIVHVGPHKTGTTYIQQTLAALHDTLLGRGIYVPSVWDAAPGLPSHMKLAWAIRNRDVALVQRQIHEMLGQRYQTVVISCEALSRLDPEQVVQLRQLLGIAPVEVVYYVRRSPERLPSLWQETVKHGHTMTFSEFLDRELRRNDTFASWDTAVLDGFSTVFGQNNVKVVAYSYLVDSNIDIAGHFLTAFLDLHDIDRPDVGRPNESMPPWDIELVRALNAIHARRGGETSAALRDWFLAHKDGLVSESVPDIMRANMGTIRLNERKPPLVLPSQHVLAQYGDSLIPPWNEDTLHGLRVIDVPFVRPDYLLEPAAAKVLLDIYQAYPGRVPST